MPTADGAVQSAKKNWVANNIQAEWTSTVAGHKRHK